MSHLPVTLYVRNDQVLELKGLKDVSVTPNVFINNATLKVTLLDAAKAKVSPVIDLVMAYVTASSGDYKADISGALNAPPGDDYWLEIEQTTAPLFHIRRPCTLAYRES